MNTMLWGNVAQLATAVITPGQLENVQSRLSRSVM
jgi:hypothetical protein